jgi:integrase
MPKTQNAIAFTCQRLNSIVPPKKGREYYRDTRTTGLLFVVTANNSRSFYFAKRIDGKPTRIKIGNYPDTTIETARRTAHRFLGEVAQGHNPYLEIKKRTKTPTLKALFHYWLEAHAKKHKKTWKTDIRVFEKYTQGLQSKPVNLITKAEATLWHQNIGNNHGKYQANRALQLVHSLFRVADQLGYTGGNPFTGVRWFPEPPRERFIQANEFLRFYEAVNQEEPLWRDLFLVSLFTGQRRNNVCRIQWTDIDLENGLWFVAGETLKNGEPLVVVLSNYVLEIFKERYTHPEKHDKWVFPSPRSTSSNPCTPRAAWERIRARSGLTDLRIHDLRRTFGSWQAINGTSLLVIGKALGHKSQRSTEIYARLIIDPVRESVEKATQKMLGYCQADVAIKNGNKIIE